MMALNNNSKITTRTLDKLYIVDESNNEVYLEVKVGAEGQTSAMTIRLDDDILVENHVGNLSKKSLGGNNSLSGKKLSVVSTIADTSKTTNLTSLTIYLTGGVASVEYPLKETVSIDGQSVDYLCLIEFFNP